jgi:Mn-containing catalase
MLFTEEEIRRGMLEVLYRRAKDSPGDPRIGREDLQKALGITDEVLDTNLSRLKEKGLVEAEGDPWLVAYISSEGVQVLDARARSYCPHL